MPQVFQFVRQIQPTTKHVMSTRGNQADRAKDEDGAFARRRVSVVCRKNRVCTGGLCPCYGGSQDA